MPTLHWMTREICRSSSYGLYTIWPSHRRGVVLKLNDIYLSKHNTIDEAKGAAQKHSDEMDDLL